MIWSFYEMLWFFYFYSALGWSVEVVYKAVKTGQFVNRGFFHGPLCPIYGIAVLLALVVLTPYKANLLILFVASTIFTSTVEFFTGLILEKIFHNKWWDYSEEPFNLKGYICLRISVMWGLSCTSAFFILQPGLDFMVNFVTRKVGMIAQLILTLIFLADMISTIIDIENIKRKIRLVDEIAVRIHAFSDKVGTTLYGGTMYTMRKSKNIKENIKRKNIYPFARKIRKYRRNRSKQKELLLKEKAELMDLLCEYKHLISRKNYYFKRIVMAYPTLRKNRLKKLIREKQYIESLIREIRHGVEEDEILSRYGIAEQGVRGTEVLEYDSDSALLTQVDDLENMLKSLLEEELYDEYDLGQIISEEKIASGE